MKEPFIGYRYKFHMQKVKEERMSNAIKDRRRGCLMGLAVGDGLGVAVEFKAPGSFAPITTYRDGGPHNLNAGDFSDDTSLALALADSIKHAGWDLNDQMKRYVSWFEEGKYSVNGWCFDIGSTTRQALEKFIQAPDATKSGLTEAYASGNGGIMRIAPVAIKYYDLFPNHLGKLFTLGAESSLTTHASTMCLLSAGYMTVVLAALINGVKREEVLDDNWFDSQTSSRHQDLEEAKKVFGWNLAAAEPVKAVVRGSYKRKHPPKTGQWHPSLKNVIRGSGFVVESLEAALWAFYDAQSFSEAVLRGINLGEDTDSVGAITGQFSGSYWGESGISLEFIEGLNKKEMIEEAISGLGVA